ncbi:MAG: DNA repair protein [Thermacetogeniaceae bacterium]|jgi:DNA repair protein RadC
MKVTEKQLTGHRQRLRDSFVAGEDSSRQKAALLELLLMYAIPQKDVQPLAQRLIDQFGDLSGVLNADLESLSGCQEVRSYTATLLKLVDWIRKHYPVKKKKDKPEKHQDLFQAILFETPANLDEKQAKEFTPRPAIKGYGSGLFAKAVLKEAIELLPIIPDTESLEDVKNYFRTNLHFSAEQTRNRYTNYITRRMFPRGYADKELRLFAKEYAGRQELKDVCFYRFCKMENSMLGIADELLIRSIGSGCLERSLLREYIAQHYPSLQKSVGDCAKAVVDALVTGGIVRADKTKLTFSYRRVLIPSFAFILHSEFPEPGMYDLARLEQNPFMRAILWQPDQLVPALYELRNRGLLSKISEIDSVRQFTTRFTLKQVTERLVAGEFER